MHRVGQRVGRSLLWQLGVAVFLVGQAAAAAQPKVVVVVDPQADSFVVKQAQAIEAALQQKLALVPLVDYLRAAKALGARPRATYGSEVAVAAGRAVGATHVLLLEAIAQRQPSRRRDAVRLATTLVDTASGENVLERRSPRESSRANQEAATRLSGEVVAAATAAPPALASAPAPGPVAPADAAVAESARQAAASPPHATPDGVAARPPAVADKGGSKAAEALPMPPLAALPPKPEAPVTVAEAEAERPVAVAKAATPPSGPYGVHVQLGGLGYQRIGLVRESGTPVLRYGGGPGKKNPLFSRINLRFELQPTRFGRTHPLRWWDGLMLFGDADMGWARTRTGTRVGTATNGSWQLGGGWRQPLGQAPWVPVVALKLGYSRYSFKLPPGSRFVSDGFAGLLAELGVEVPLGTPVVAVVGQAGLIAGLKSFGGAEQLGSRMRRGLGGRVEAGLRFLIVRHLDVDLAFNWQRYRVDFDGSSRVAGFARRYSAVGFSDQALGGTLRVGARF